ncbi:hypothetical protein [Edwardsiella tarda]|uniref:hypothetical protein n=1 Tax=Edwardsiella tarda TaxID=636 RepID=UPI0011155B13|nr:hypothetical protein [Edwardsiella tarda]
MIIEKVLFSYASLIRDGQAPQTMYPPDTVLYDIDNEKNYSLSVTAGFVTTQDENYWYEIDVTFNGKSVIDSNDGDDGSFIIWVSSRPSADQYVNTSSFFLKSVKFHHSGMYTITVSLYKKQQGSEDNKYLDTKECFLIVPEGN